MPPNLSQSASLLSSPPLQSPTHTPSPPSDRPSLDAPLDEPPLRLSPAVKRHLVGLAITFAYGLIARGFDACSGSLRAQIENAFGALLSIPLDVQRLELMWISRSLPPFDHNSTPIYCPTKSVYLFDLAALEESWMLLVSHQLPEDAANLFPSPLARVPPFVVEYAELIDRFAHERRCHGIAEPTLVEHAASKAHNDVLSAFFTEGYIVRSAHAPRPPVAVLARKCTRLCVRWYNHKLPQQLCATCLKLRRSLKNSLNKSLHSKARDKYTVALSPPATVQESQLRKLDELLQSPSGRSARSRKPQQSSSDYVSDFSDSDLMN